MINNIIQCFLNVQVISPGTVFTPKEVEEGKVTGIVGPNQRPVNFPGKQIFVNIYVNFATKKF